MNILCCNIRDSSPRDLLGICNDFGCMAAVGIVQKEDKTRESFARISLASKLELISQLWQGEIGLQCCIVTSVVEFKGTEVWAN